MRGLKRWWWLVPVLLLAALGTFAAWAESGPAPMPEARRALEKPADEDGVVVVERSRWITFRPTEREVSSGLILYPGGRVEPTAYAPTARAIAEEGYLVVIVPMPLDLAFFAPQRASAVQEAFPAVEHWTVGGHSLGGAMAARYAHERPTTIDGLLLWAAYPAESNDLSGHAVAVVSIYGTRDGLATADKIDASRSLLPPDTGWVPIEGGNHAQFGWHGPQRGDGEAAISREAQQRQVIDGSVRLLAAIDP